MGFIFIYLHTIIPKHRFFFEINQRVGLLLGTNIYIYIYIFEALRARVDQVQNSKKNVVCYGLILVNGVYFQKPSQLGPCYFLINGSSCL